MSIVGSAKAAAQGAVQAVMKKGIELAPDSWLPGGKPDPLIRQQHGLVGAPISRIDGPLKVQGRAKFAAEFPIDQMAYAALMFSTIAKGRIATLDTAEAEAAPGVVLVMTHRNAPRMKNMPLFMSTPKSCGGDNLPIMQDDHIHWNGQPVAVVLAETQEQADHAKSLIHVTYDRETAVTAFAEAKTQGTDPGMFQGEPLKMAIGDAEAALAKAAASVDYRYDTPRHTHAAIEPHAATVAWNGDQLMVHDATQAVAHTAASLASIFGIDEANVHVTSPYVGGGFGSKTLWQHQVLGAAASKLAGRPVRIALSREGVYRIVGGRTVTEQRVAIGAEADGHFTAIIHTGTVAMTRSNAMPEPFIMGTRATYAADTFKLDVETAYLDMLANTFMRAPGEAVGTFALECAVDELAAKLDMDPIELRIRNEPEKDPTEGTALLLPARGGGLARRCRALRLGQAQPGPGYRSRGRVAGRRRLRDRHLPLLPHARRCRAHHPDQGRPRHGGRGGARDGHGDGDGAEPGGRRSGSG